MWVYEQGKVGNINLLLMVSCAPYLTGWITGTVGQVHNLKCHNLAFCYFTSRKDEKKWKNREIDE